MSKKSLLVVLLIGVLATLVVAPAAAQDKVQVTWFVGLGTGTNEQQIEAENQVVADFNASQDEIELVINIAASNETAPDLFSTLVAGGTPPDIVGPVGVGGSNQFADQWLDLQPLVDATGYDLSVYDPALVELYKTADGELLGIPFAVFPSITYYNPGLFDEAGLNYPPQAFDEMYVMPDGTEVEWNYETAAEIAKILTVDANGNDATSADFDPSAIEQFGLNFQWARMRLMWTDIQPEDWYDEAANKVSIPESWRTATQWLQDAVWKDHFIPNTTYDSSEAFGSGNAYQSGKLAMAITPLWYTCCLGESVGKFEWDFGVVPKSLDGEYHVATDADTFRLTKSGTNQEAAFTVLQYLLNEAVPVLAPTYGAFPARPEYQQDWIDTKAAQFDWGVNWQVAVDSLAYNVPGNMHHESNVPNYGKATDRVFAFQTALFGDGGGDLDVNAELDKLETEVQAIIDGS
ncbi:MAG: sugar ABC transporter substrate-binding protein [Chloroflexi bacterium]|nr:sugar ABC transporter substrate-binding protein [Chloroflexota bacterium]MCC6891460.1 sugar ABC transporter substrate-binding protein [Anaerolineae bacterium]